MEYTDYTLKRDVDEFKDLDWNTLGKIADMLNKEKTKADIYGKITERIILTKLTS